MFLKQFAEWTSLKNKLHKKSHVAPYVSEGDIWWASIGENVGSEIDGKNSLFSRPVIIYKKLSHHFLLYQPQQKTRREVGMLNSNKVEKT